MMIKSFSQKFPNDENHGQVTLLLSEQDVNLVGDDLDYKENAATKLLRVIIAKFYLRWVIMKCLCRSSKPLSR